MNPPSLKGLSVNSMIAYLDHRLSPEEEAQVDALLAAEPAYITALYQLERYLEKHPDSREALLGLEQSVESFLSEAGGKDSVERRTLAFRPWMVAAAAALLLLISMPWWLKGTSAEDLARQSLVHYPYGERGANTPDVPRSDALLTYIQAENDPALYAVAARKIKALPERDTELDFYLGVSLALSGQHNEAATNLKISCDDANNELIRAVKEDACWYFALHALLQGNTGEALPILRDIAAHSSREERSKAASKILKKL